jgi:hypothetical protein
MENREYDGIIFIVDPLFAEITAFPSLAFVEIDGKCRGVSMQKAKEIIGIKPELSLCIAHSASCG